MTIAPATIVLACVTCGTTWRERRRRGLYKLRCAGCRRRGRVTARQAAIRLAFKARGRGLDADAARHPRQGWVVAAATPWHEGRVVLRDELDIQFLRAELSHER